ncbi:potassium ion/proton antiporter [Aspergillus japonicus CBS 114.51]|uniref:Potassium ion/proton antiporter n=1 Tax=Aspergillus japonicus CBS 114.51 TaxID=1448312 RepID=A0A8T8X271_ASPJA|nr:potassium ion/proton antiporter [Aspergillus japonicus CBS 114.51]RAH82000.1 potassium ion/proton antiporter [Aspergillus japonicus CBS 114.51]
MSSNSTTSQVKSQAGILEGSNPTVYDSSNPIILFIIQASIIIVLCRLLHWPLSKIRQPRVIAEVIAGVVLGPSVMGRIPGFTDAIFPKASIPGLNLVANLGLILFLFLVGLETNLRFLISNWRVAVSVSAAGMVLPFGLGCAVAYGLYNAFRNEPDTVDINFGTYLLFIGIAMAITAFPVLCRILTELKLLGTNVGVIVLSAGVGNDVVGWILLALCVALVNAGSGLTALWVLLVCVGYVLFLIFIFRPLFLRFLAHTGSLQKGPSQSVVAITLLLALASAFFTQVIGVHAIFGGFLIGLLCPHEGGFAIKLTEKIEDLVAALFLPLYFTLSGLQTNLGLLDNGTVWGYVIAIIAIAFIAKVTGGALASRLNGLLWRESFSIGVLMSCKGLVELIVLNIGLQAKILSTRTFTMFVVMALVTTFATTPLTVALYPKWYQIKVDRWRRGEIDWATGKPLPPDSRMDSITAAKSAHHGDHHETLGHHRPVRNLLVYLRLDGLSGLCTLAGLLAPNTHTHNNTHNHPRVHPDKRTPTSLDPDTKHADESAPAETEITELDAPAPQSLQVHGVRLLELTDRDSSVMKVSEIEQYTLSDPVVNTFRAFGQWHDLSIVAGVSVVPEHSFADTVVGMAREEAADLVLLPWSETGAMGEQYHLHSPVEEGVRFLDGQPYAAFVGSVLDGSPAASANVGVLVERNLYAPQHALGAAGGGASGVRHRPSLGAMSVQRSSSVWNARGGGGAAKAHHIVVPFVGGRDDRLAVRFVCQVASCDLVTVSVVHLEIPGATGATGSVSASGSGVVPEELVESDAAFLSVMKDSLDEEVLDRVVFKKTAVKTEAEAVATMVELVKDEMVRSYHKAGNLVVVGRRHSALDELLASQPDGGAASAAAHDEVGAEAARVLGVLGQALVKKENRIVGDVLVMQSK